MDKVYIRILSVSLLLSLCGAGVVQPDAYKSILYNEIFASQSTRAPLVQSRAILQSSSWGKLKSFKSFFSSISSRLAEMCLRVGRPADVESEEGGAFRVGAHSHTGHLAAVVGGAQASVVVPVADVSYGDGACPVAKVWPCPQAPIRAGPWC